MKKQAGFTLIELIMVIVILGILAAFALPRFADLSGDAETAKINGALGAIKSASAIAHSACLADSGCTNTDNSTVDLDGASNLDMDFGYPGADSATTGIAVAADLTGYGITTSTVSGVATLIITNNTSPTNGSECISYTEATAASNGPSIGTGSFTAGTPATCS